MSKYSQVGEQASDERGKGCASVAKRYQVREETSRVLMFQYFDISMVHMNKLDLIKQ